MKNTHYAIIAALILLIGGASFYGGIQYQKTRINPAGDRQNFGRPGGLGGPGGRGMQAGGNRAQGGFTNGEILSTDAQGMTLKLIDGGSKIIFFSASTTIGKMDTGTKDDLKQGSNVMITGTPNQDGSITANSVQIRPAGNPIIKN